MAVWQQLQRSVRERRCGVIAGAGTTMSMTDWGRQWPPVAATKWNGLVLAALERCSNLLEFRLDVSGNKPVMEPDEDVEEYKKRLDAYRLGHCLKLCRALDIDLKPLQQARKGDLVFWIAVRVLDKLTQSAAEITNLAAVEWAAEQREAAARGMRERALEAEGAGQHQLQRACLAAAAAAEAITEEDFEKSAAETARNARGWCVRGLFNGLKVGAAVTPEICTAPGGPLGVRCNTNWELGVRV